MVIQKRCALFLRFCVFLLVLSSSSWLAACGAALQTADKAEPAAGQSLAREADTQRVAAAYGKLQIPFISNQGQTDAVVRFYAPAFGGTVFVTDNGELVYSLPQLAGKATDSTPPAASPQPPAVLVLKEALAGAKVSEVTGEGQGVTTVNSFKGNDRSQWQHGIPTYEAVSLGEVYQGVELKLRAHGKNVEKLFVVKPGATVESIRVKVSGGELHINAQGELEVTGGNTHRHPLQVKFTRPVAYQEYEGKKAFIDVAYVVNGEEYGFTVGEYDRDRALVIDPLLAATFVGGSSSEEITAIAIDAEGSIYVAGSTLSSDFPTTPGAFDTSNNGDFDVFVAKLDGDLIALEAATFLGGGRSDFATSIAIDAQGSIYVTGQTPSGNFPTTTGAFDTSHNGNIDVFVAKLDGDLTTLEAATFLGGSRDDEVGPIAIHVSGVYVAGNTRSANFPTTFGAFDRRCGTDGRCNVSAGFPQRDAFVSQLNGRLTRLSASTFLGGNQSDVVTSIALGPGPSVGLPDIFVAGSTISSDFPTTPGAFDTALDGPDAFVSRLSGGLKTLRASTFLGGDGLDDANAVALSIPDGNGAGSFDVFVVGDTLSPDFPTTPGAFDTSFKGVPTPSSPS